MDEDKQQYYKSGEVWWGTERKGECLLWVDGRAREVLIYQGTQGLRDSYSGTHQ